MRVHIYGASAEKSCSRDADTLSVTSGTDLSAQMLTEINSSVKISLCESFECFTTCFWNGLNVVICPVKF
jgi:hypothetical protein